eukprot:Gb_20623 [translate_table: standard]
MFQQVSTSQLLFKSVMQLQTNHTCLGSFIYILIDFSAGCQAGGNPVNCGFSEVVNLPKEIEGVRKSLPTGSKDNVWVSQREDSPMSSELLEESVNLESKMLEIPGDAAVSKGSGKNLEVILHSQEEVASIKCSYISSKFALVLDASAVEKAREFRLESVLGGGGSLDLAPIRSLAVLEFISRDIVQSAKILTEGEEENLMDNSILESRLNSHRVNNQLDLIVGEAISASMENREAAKIVVNCEFEADGDGRGSKLIRDKGILSCKRRENSVISANSGFVV